MLRQLLDEETLAEFFASHFHRLPFAQPDGVRDARSWITWKGLGELLAAVDPADQLVVRNGRLIDGGRARNPRELEALLRFGCSVIVRRAEVVDTFLAEVGASFAEEVGGPATVHVFASPEGHHSFGWHYDCEDVFVVQSDGHKDMYLRRNTVNPEPTVDTMPMDMRFEDETSPLQVCALLPQDWLYIPRGWWHVARCRSACLTVSVGVLSEAARARTTSRDAVRG